LVADVGFEPTTYGLEDRRSNSAELIGVENFGFWNFGLREKGLILNRIGGY
jgi:hypothetical protein